jgi:hypothetical protein
VSVLASTFLCCFLCWTHFSFEIGAGKITALLAVKSVDAGALRHTSDHLGRPGGSPVHSLVTPTSGEHRGQQLFLVRSGKKPRGGHMWYVTAAHMRHIPRLCVLCAGTVNQIPPLASHSAFYGHRNRKVVVFTINLVCLIYLLQVHAVPSYGLCEGSTWIAEGCCAQQTGVHGMDGSNCLIEYYLGSMIAILGRRRLL